MLLVLKVRPACSSLLQLVLVLWLFGCCVSGPAGAAPVWQLLAAWPVMKPLVLVLKVR
jgi:hypothetical protein